MSDTDGWNERSGGAWSTAPDGQLFERMATRGSNARAAFEELYRRYAGAVYASFRWVAPAVHYGKDDLLQDTFIRAYERADRYVAGDDPSPAAQQRRTRGWLSKTAEFLIREKWPRDRAGFVRIVQLTHLCWRNMCEDRGHVDAPTPDAERVRVALASLSARDREIILIYMHWYDPDLDNQQIPGNIQDQLRSHFDITRENLRQIVHRTLKRLAADLERDS